MPLYENIVDEEKGKLNEDGSLNLNPHSLVVLKECYVEPALAEGKAYDSYQSCATDSFVWTARTARLRIRYLTGLYP